MSAVCFFNLKRWLISSLLIYWDCIKVLLFFVCLLLIVQHGPFILTRVCLWYIVMTDKGWKLWHAAQIYCSFDFPVRSWKCLILSVCLCCKPSLRSRVEGLGRFYQQQRSRYSTSLLHEMRFHGEMRDKAIFVSVWSQGTTVTVWKAVLCVCVFGATSSLGLSPKNINIHTQ